MVSKKLVIPNPTGLHARPAGMFCEQASRFNCSVTLRREGSAQTFNGKSILHILMGKFSCGTQVELVCDGEDEAKALDELSGLIQGFTE